MNNYIYIIIILLIVYSSLYYIFTDEFSIYQTKTNNFNIDLLYYKQPIVISDNIDIDNILQNWFMYNIINYNIPVYNIWQRNPYKYLLVYAKEKGEVTLCNAKTKTNNNAPDPSAKITTIKLNDKAIIIPFKWYYHTTSNVEVYGIHDYITRIISMVC